MERLAEFIGILLGDGSISLLPSKQYSTFYCVKVTLDKRECQYRDYVAQQFFDVFGVMPKIKERPEQNTVDICNFTKQAVQKVLSLGMLTSPKWHRAVIPKQYMSREFGKYILRGYFDTDGSVVLTNNNGTCYPRLEMKISPAPMQQQLIALLDLYGFRFGVYNIGKGKVRVQMNGKRQLEKWLAEIGFSNLKHLTKAEYFLCFVTFKSNSSPRQS